jgi:hypothetical protein
MTADPVISTTPDEGRAVKDRLADLSALIHASGHMSEAVRSALIRSLDELSAAFSKVDQENRADRERVVRATEAITHLAVQPTPNQSLITHGLTSLADSVHVMTRREPIFVEVVGRIAIALNEIGI